MTDIKTLILCGGRGLRLRPLTDTIPKPLVHLNGKPIIHHSIDMFIKKGFNKFIICVGYKGEMVKNYLIGQDFDASLEFCHSGDSASMLARIHDASELLTENTIVSYGDTLIDINLNQLIESHIAQQAKITIITADVISPFGLVKTDINGRVDSFEEKPTQSYYIGHMILQKDLLQELDSRLLALPDGDGLVSLFKELIREHLLYTYRYNGPQITFNTQSELTQAQSDFISFFTHQEDSI
ncbi:MAG: hypothetical protein CL886_03570 [Dehalococcoidia bacterium]|nr:hypothetical protein [Dehalococcoidia bacterium]|tara:strand:- start:759 stop:1478 length:720 start_codon:yes stop_codon:yes gene_type:complete